MTIVATILAALPLGFLVRQRGLAVVGYLAGLALVFTYQSVTVLLSWMADEPPVAFGPSPTGEFPVAYSSSETWGYGAVNLAVAVVGVGLVVLGGRLRARRDARASSAVVA